MARRLDREAATAPGHRYNIVGSDGFAFTPSLDANAIVVEEDGWNAPELQTTSNGKPVMAVHDEQFAFVDGDRLRPHLLADDLAFEAIHPIKVDVFGGIEGGWVQQTP